MYVKKLSGLVALATLLSGVLFLSEQISGVEKIDHDNLIEMVGGMSLDEDPVDPGIICDEYTCIESNAWASMSVGSPSTLWLEKYQYTHAKGSAQSSGWGLSGSPVSNTTTGSENDQYHNKYQGVEGRVFCDTTGYGDIQIALDSLTDDGIIIKSGAFRRWCDGPCGPVSGSWAE